MGKRRLGCSPREMVEEGLLIGDPQQSPEARREQSTGGQCGRSGVCGEGHGRRGDGVGWATHGDLEFILRASVEAHSHALLPSFGRVIGLLSYYLNLC